MKMWKKKSSISNPLILSCKAYNTGISSDLAQLSAILSIFYTHFIPDADNAQRLWQQKTGDDSKFF